MIVSLLFFDNVPDNNKEKSMNKNLVFMRETGHFVLNLLDWAGFNYECTLHLSTQKKIKQIIKPTQQKAFVYNTGNNKNNQINKWYYIFEPPANLANNSQPAAGNQQTAPVANGAAATTGANSGWFSGWGSQSAPGTATPGASTPGTNGAATTSTSTSWFGGKYSIKNKKPTKKPTKKPVVKKPVKKPTTKKSAVKKPTTKKPVVKKNAKK